MSDHSSGKATGAATTVSEPSSSRPKSNKFRFKSHKRTHDTEHDLDDRPHKRTYKSDRSRSQSQSPRRHRHHHRRHRTSSKHHTRYPHPQHSPSPTEEHRAKVADAIPDAPEDAFRESLFDALADDEGAAYWESFYGQPIHVYARPTEATPQGELEAMTDEEYAAYVRARMYERTHQHVIEERARAEEARKARREREKASQRGDGDEAFRKRVEESLARGEKRKERGRWKEAWEVYLVGWARVKSRAMGEGERVVLPWPVRSGKMKDVSKVDVEDFMRHAPEGTEQAALLKTERVRWHPDKAQQRFGGQLDEEALQAVTAVFQILDRMWNEVKTSRAS